MLAILSMAAFRGQSVSGAEKAPDIKSIARPAAGYTEIIFHGPTGPFRLETRASMDPNAPWVDMPEALVTELGPRVSEVMPRVFMGQFLNSREEFGFYRVVSESDGIAELEGWTVLVRVSKPANGSFFVQQERPVVTVRILDNYAQGVTRSDFSSLNLYMYGPQDPTKTVTAAKLLRASTDRSKTPHHYINLKDNADVQVKGSTLTYQLNPITDEAPGTYTLSVWSVLAADPIQQIMKLADIQIGTATVESPVVAAKAIDGTPKCAACHEGTLSGKLYLHHIDPASTPGSVGNWSLDYAIQNCKSCHNNEGYAAYRDTTSVPGVTNRISDTLVRRVHGVHNGAHLALPFNTNHVNGDFKDYLHVNFPADIEGRPLDCTKCHLDDRWQTEITQKSCGACHDNVWFGPLPVPAGWVAHVGRPQINDNKCLLCHGVDEPLALSVADAHKEQPPKVNMIDVAMTPPGNGKYYVEGEKPVVSLVFKNDANNSIGDHALVTTANFSTASLFVYGPRNHAVPVLTSMAKLGVETKRASVTCSKDGPWPIDGKTLKIGINGTAPQDITFLGAGGLVTPAEVVSSLNAVITNLNGGAKATLSGSKVMIKSLIRGAAARIEIYNGEVTTAMGWKAKGVVLEPDVFVAAVSTAGNDLRPVADPLDFTDPMVTRTATNILYKLDDIAGLAAGTYHIYAYYLPVTNKIVGLNAKTGIGHTLFQVGTSTPEKKIASNCTDCHGDTVWHLAEGPIHAEPFNTDYCLACHDYGHPNTGDLFKGQGGTSLNGWSGFGAMPNVNRIHGVHRGNYLEHPEQIYANATVDTFGHIIFPMDVRNCTKCHSESDSWKNNPSRMACLACHDSDDAKVHGKIFTYMPNPNDPYGPTAVETCAVCHEAAAAFSAEKVHSITKPYVPPYPRSPRE